MRSWLRPAVACLLILSLVSGACQAPAPASIRFMVFGDPAEIAAYQKLADVYLAKHPDQKVEVVSIPSQSDYRQRLTADFAAGTPADVVLVNYRRLTALAARGALEPLGPYLYESKLIRPADFYPQALQAFTVAGQIVCIPQNISSPVAYYNRDLFDSAGVAYPKDDWNWEAFVETARALTQDTDGDGHMDQYGLGSEVSLIRLSSFVWQNGDALVDNVFAPTKFTLDTGPGREAFQWFVEFANSVEGQTLVAETGRTVPSLIAVAESPDFLESDEPPANSRAFLDAIPDVMTLPFVSTWPEIEELADEQIRQAFYGQVSVEEAARRLNALAQDEFLRGTGAEID